METKVAEFFHTNIEFLYFISGMICIFLLVLSIVTFLMDEKEKKIFSIERKWLVGLLFCSAFLCFFLLASNTIRKQKEELRLDDLFIPIKVSAYCKNNKLYYHTKDEEIYLVELKAGKNKIDCK